MVTQKYLHEILLYDSETGLFTWKVKRSSTAMKGQIAGTICNGYICIRIDKKRYMAHRLAWLYAHGNWPESQIDHINGIAADNRIKNLREATQKQNMENRCISNSNTSGFHGVSWDKRANKWKARVAHYGKVLHLGYFDDKELASIAVKKLRQGIFTHYERRS